MLIIRPKRSALRLRPKPLAARAKNRREAYGAPHTVFSSGTDFVRATFSHKGRRGSAQLA